MGFVRSLVIFYASASLIAGALPSADAAKLYPFTGTVTAVSPDSIRVQHGLETLDFTRAPLGADADSHLRIGDKVTVWYSMNVKKIKPVSSERGSRGAPGRAAPENPDRNDNRPSIIQDDRAFFNAKNEGRRGNSSSRDLLKKNS